MTSTNCDAASWRCYCTTGSTDRNSGAGCSCPHPAPARQDDDPRQDAAERSRDSWPTSIEAVIVERKIDIVSIDPFVKSHSVEENTNSAIDDVVQVLTDLADKHNIAIDAPHHTSKGTADPGNANRGRGASAMKDGAASSTRSRR